MNSACIIAACAANARRNNHNKLYNIHIDTDCELYYQVNFRMYVHFRPLQAVRNLGEFLVGSFHAPIVETFIEPVNIKSQTIAKAHSFTLWAGRCPDGPDKYIEANIKRYTTSDVWLEAKEEIINKYLEDIKNKYNIILEESSLDYTIQYCWEVDGVC